MKFHITHKTEEFGYKVRSKRISSWKQRALAITFELASAILKDFFQLWSKKAFDMERVSYLYVSYFFFS